MKYENVEEKVVISGIGCKLPESDTIEEFAEKLFGGQYMVTRDDRKLSQGLFENLPEYSGKIRDIRKFDYTFFGISNIVVQCMDPMTQQIMERTFEAVLDAGINPSELRGTDTAVYSGTSISDFDLEWASNYRGGYGIMGRNRCMNANRVSYWLDLKGTSSSTDTTWVNGLNNLMGAWDSIRKGRCDTALVSTANLQSNAEITIQLNDMGFLCPDGVCSPYDDSANGYARSDAIVVFVLQRESIARRNYAIIEQVLSKCYGNRDNVIQRPLQEHWEDLYNEIYSRSNIDINSICYLEGHGSGIKEEDTVELNAITNFFCRKRTTPLLLGSVKSNMGHAEACAASCGLIKTLIALERGIIPQNLNFTTPNSEACHGFQSGKLKLVDRNTPLPENGLVAVNAHGFGGVYAHIILRKNPKPKVMKFDGIPRLVLMAGRTNELMDNVLNRIESMPVDAEYISLVNSISARKVDKYLGRGYTILPKKEGSVMHDHQVYNEMKRPVWFIFSGMGSQWPTMGKRLMSLPIFRESIEKCHKILESKGLDLINIITGDDPKTFDNIMHSFVGIAAMQIALIDIMNALKIVPDGMIGHSVGELGCAYADGCFTREQMILSAYSRGRASLESNLIKGFMAAIGRGYNQLKDELPEGIEIACHNAADSCTISGPAEKVQEYVKELESKGIFARTVNVSNIAYHSRYIKPAAPRLLKYLKEVIPSPKLRSARWISTSNLEENWNTELAKYCSAEYHTNNLLSSVLFEEGCKHIPNNAICIEIAPHGLLQAILKRALGEECTNISLTHRTTEDPLVFLLQAIGKLFMAGLEPQIENIYPKVEFPVSRGTPSIHQLVYWDHEVDLAAAQTRAEKKVIYSIKNHFLKTAPDSIGYIINGENTYPVGVFLHLVWSIFATLKKMKTEDCPVLFENIRIECPMAIHPNKNDEAMITLQKGTGDFEINTTHLLARGNISFIPETNLKMEEDPDFSFNTDCTMTRDEIYGEFQSKGYDIGENFRRLESINIGNTGWTAEVGATANWIQTIESLFQLQIIHMGEDSVSPKFPKSFERMIINPQNHLKNKTSLGESKTMTASYDVIQNKINCGGIKMKGFQVQELPLSTSTLKFCNKYFVPFMNPTLKDISQYVHFCLDVVIDNIKSFSAENELNLIEVINDTDGIVLTKNLEESFPSLKLKVQKVSNVKKIEGKKIFDFVICPMVDLENCLTFVSESGLILAKSMKSQANKIPVGIELVSRYTGRNFEEFFMFKKKLDNKEEPEFILIPKSEAILVSIVHGLTASNRPVYLVGYGEPDRGISNIQKKLQAETNILLRWIFILDEDPSLRDTTNKFYKEQVKNGLTTNIFKDGSWGFFLQQNYTLKQLDPDLFSVKKLNKELSEYLISFDFSRNMIEMKQVEYSGKLKNDSRIIGVGSVLKDASIIRDKYLWWNLPESWSLEDGATIPLAYVYAYYCIVVVGHLKPFESLFVTDGATPLGMAAIEVGMSIASSVYVTVGNLAEATVLKNRFPSLPRENILFHEDKNFHIQLGFITQGKNPEMIISQLEDEKLMSTCSCLCPYGRIFHFGLTDFKKNVQLGTSIFLLSTSFYSMTQDVLINLNDNERQKIKDLIEKGLRSEIVKPLPRKIFSLKEFQKLVIEGKNIPRKEKVILADGGPTIEKNLLQIDSDSSYVIIGNESEVWIDIMRYLVRKGARKLVVSHNGHSKRAERHAKFIRKYNILVHEEETVKDIKNLFVEAQKLGPISAVYLVALKSSTASKILSQVDKLYRDEKGFLVVISKEDGTASDTCLKRNQSGFPSSNFIWSAEEMLIGREMELVNKLCGRDPVISVSHTLKGALDADSKDQMLREILPESIHDFCRLGASLGNDIRITELPCQSGYCNTKLKEICPLIFIGGLHNDPVELLMPLAKQLIYPSCCVHLPNKKMSIKQMVSFILPKIFDLRGDGDLFNIVGLSWGCYIAIELAKQIEEIGGKVGLILVDCPHQNLKISLAEDVSWESDLINVIQSFSKTIQSDALALDKTWSLKLNRVITTLDLSEKEETLFRNAADFIFNSLSALREYDITEIRLRGPLTVIKSGPQSSDDRTISRMCNCISVRSIPVGGREAITSKEFKEIIHGSAIAQTMSSSTVNYCSWRDLEDFLIQQKLSDFNSLTTDFRVTATKLKFSFTH